MRDREIAIVGYSETKIEYRSGRHVFDFAGEALARPSAIRALAADIRQMIESAAGRWRRR